MSLPDFKEKQILVVKSDLGDRAFLRVDNDNIVFYKNGELKNKIPSFKIFVLFVIGDVAITGYLLRKLASYGASVVFMSRNLNAYSVINAFGEGNYILRNIQYKLGNLKELEMAKHLVKNKIYNQKLLLKYKAGVDLSLSKSKKELDEKIDPIFNEKELLGVEGNFSKDFFQVFFKENGINWHKRAPRSKYDEYNLLLDMGYTFLFNFIDSILKIYGFDTYKGFYHKLFFQRKSLSCDIMEPFRCIIDKQIVKSFNLGQIDKDDFGVSNGRYFLKIDKQEKYIKIFIEAILKHKEDIFVYIKDFYRYLMSDDKTFPEFYLKLK